MAEIKNTFTQGKMNKDLDERILPNGQYRDAMNVEITTSEGSDVGTVQNILGNDTIEQFVPASGYKCVGSISDEKTNSLYWLVKGSNIEAVLEYSLEEGVKPVIIDTKAGTIDAVLKFPDKIITGINIIDNLLLWTDGVNEPRRINIDRCKQGNTTSSSLTSSSHTKLIVQDQDKGDIKEDHITAIKKSPLKPVSYQIESANADAKSPLFEKIFPRFSYRYKYVDGEYSTFAPFTEVVFKSLYGEDPEGVPYTQDNAYNIEDPYNNGMRNMISQINLYGFVSPDIPEDVVEIDLLYKQEDSTVIYILENIKNTSEYWDSDIFSEDSSYKGSFIVKTENIYAAVPENQSLRVWDALPKSAISQEVTGNRVVYGNYKQAYDLLNENGQTINPSARADYGQRKTFAEEYNFENGGIPSLKSQRNYQVGVVYGDKYGRETPVFTDEESSFKVNWSDASLAGQIKANATSAHPEWADYYKFFVKETSGEYYNLIMDAIYIPTVEDIEEINEKHVWLSFPSSDRNKVKEEDYIILKRSLNDTGNGQIATENKYKVLDVQNEAPDAIKYKYLPYGEVLHEEVLDLNTELFKEESRRPNQDGAADYLQINAGHWHNDEEGRGQSLTINESTSEMDGDLYISFNRQIDGNLDQTERYKIASIRYVDGDYLLKLTKPITEDDASIIVSAGSPPTFKSDVAVIIEKKILKNLEAFSGRFFVKVSKRGEIKQLQQTAEAEIINRVSATAKSYWHADVQNAVGDYDPTTGIVNSDSLQSSALSADDVNSVTGAGNLTKTEAAWDAILDQVKTTSKFFIDNMYFASSQPVLDDEKAYARFSGHGWSGGKPSFPAGSGAGDIIYPTYDGHEDIFGIPQATLPVPSGYNKERCFPVTLDVNRDNNQISFPKKNVIIPTDPGANGENMINGVDGLIVTGDNHVAGGIKRWRRPHILEQQAGMIKQGYTNDYRANKKVLHLSFLAPGEDLHDGAFPPTNYLDVRNTEDGGGSLSNWLQGIWGGGVFTNEDGSEFTNTVNNVDLDCFFCEGLDGPCNQNPPKKTGYDNNYRSKHLRQWKPEWSGGSLNLNVAKIINRIKNPGTKFRFKNGSDEVGPVFTIAKTTVKRLYNHTPWRKMYQWDGVSGSGNVVTTGDSVEDAAVDFGNSPTSANANTLYDRVERFGKRNNRRVLYIIELTDDSPDPTIGDFNPVDADSSVGLDINSVDFENIEFVDPDFNLLNGNISENPAIWETEPKENVDLDIYYEASQALPTKITLENAELFAPIGSRVEFLNSDATTGITEDIFLTSWEFLDFGDGPKLGFEISIDVNEITNLVDGVNVGFSGEKVRFIRPNGSYTTGKIFATTNNKIGFRRFRIDTTVDPGSEVGLSWYNCFSFGNGIESNRIRDDFNAMKLSGGAIANSTIDRTYKEEHKQNGLIYSGIYSSTGLINSLNEFISAEKITKDLNPTFGSIQKLFQRRVSLIAFCEDRVVSIVSNKDSIFNADGNPQLISSTSVLGDATPFVGDYGISKNPESFSKEGYRAYFTDKQRGAVIRLSMDGLTPISDAGMRDYFRDNLDIPNQIIGSYDSYKKDYNLTLANYLPENVIQNNLIEQGEGGSTESFIDTELIVNNSFTNGTSISNPSVPSNIAENSDLRTVTNIFNYDLIPAGSLQAAQTEVTAQNWNFGIPSATNRVIFEFINDGSNSNFGSSNSQGVYDPRFNGVIAPLTNPSTVYFGETGDRKSQARLQAIVTGPEGLDPEARAKFTINGQGKPFFRNSITDGLGASSFVDGLFFRTQDLDQSLVDPDVLAATNPALPITSNTTTFNGEEYKFSMYIQNFDVNGNEDVNLVINICEGGGQINGAFLVAGDAATVGTTNTPTDDPTYSNDINMGWVTDSSITLPNFPEGSHRIEFYLKAGNPDEGIHVNTSDPNNKVILAPIFDYLNIHFSHDDPIKNNSILIREFKVEKIKKLTHPGRLFVPGIPAQPPSDIPAHTVVRQDGLITTGASGSGGWSATVDANATVAEAILDQGAINEFGDDNYPATTVTYDIIDNDPTSATYGQDIGDGTYLTGNPNGVSDYFSQGFVTTNTPGTGGVDVTIDITNADGSVIGKRGGFGRPGNVISIVADGDGETVQLTQDVTNNPLVVDNWYELKLTGVTGIQGNTSILVMDALDPSTFPSNLPSDPRGETLPGHMGEIAGALASPKQIKLVQDGSELRCIWQQKHNSSLNELKINFFRCDVTIDAIEFADVTEKQTGGDVDDWSTLNATRYHYYSPRNRVYHYNGDNIRWGYKSDPSGFYDEPGYGSQNVNSETFPQANYAVQNIDLEPTNDGYVLTFFVTLLQTGVDGNGNAQYNSGTLSGYLTGGYEDVDPGQTYGVEFTVRQGGRYRIEGNLDGVTQPTITRVDADYTTPASGTDSSLMSVAIKTFPGPGHADKLLFAPVQGGQFLGTLQECSVKDATNYFTPTTADSWVFDGFDPGLENFITFDDVNQNILFTNAPNTVSLQQAITTNFPTGSVVQLKFDVENYTSGSISGYYYNQDGEGFVFGPINTNENFDTESDLANRVTIGDSTATGGEILNTLVIFVESGNFNATLDNFELYRIYPDYTPTTITYSEDVKGWTSFKSFVPEVGVNMSSKYYTFKNAKLYKHYIEGMDYNTFYGEHVESSITAVLNQQPDTIKIFNALSYEGTQSKINQYTIDTDTGLTNASIYNLNAKDGWYAANIVTDKQSGSIKEFIEKEGKWFNYIKGAEILDTQLPSTAEFSFQGLGIVSITETI
jgi:hypothetical protein